MWLVNIVKLAQEILTLYNLTHLCTIFFTCSHKHNFWPFFENCPSRWISNWGSQKNGNCPFLSCNFEIKLYDLPPNHPTPAPKIHRRVFVFQKYTSTKILNLWNKDVSAVPCPMPWLPCMAYSNPRWIYTSFVTRDWDESFKEIEFNKLGLSWAKLISNWN